MHSENLRSLTDQTVEKYVTDYGDARAAEATEATAAELAQLRDTVDQLTRERDTLSGSVTNLNATIAGLRARIQELEAGTPPVVTDPPPTSGGNTGNPLPDLPTIKYEDLYRAGDTFGQAIARMTSKAVVLLPDGFDGEVVDFAYGNYGVHDDQLLGIGGAGRGRSRIRLRPGSSTKGSTVPAQGSGSTNQLNIMRVGLGGAATTLFGLTIEGSDQGHLYNGISVYKAEGAVWQDLYLRGVNPGDYSSPPGETFGVNSFRTKNFTMRNVEIDGRDTSGKMVSASPYGGNACDGDVLEDCYFHDAYVSSATWSFAGSPDNADSTSRNVTTRNLRIENNANHKMASGFRFAGINHENVTGFIRHVNPTIILDPVANSEWLTAHLVIVNVLQDNPNIEVIEPTWANGSPLNRGCFVIRSGKTFLGKENKQVSSPRVVKNGRVLTPYRLTAYSGSGVPSNVNPETHYVHIVA